MTKLSAFGWYLTNTEDNHNKDYLVVIIETGVAVMTWGRIGSAGQGKIMQGLLADCDSTGKRQVYEKAAKGYDFEVNGLKFKIEADVVQRMLQRHNNGVGHAWEEVAQVFKQAAASSTGAEAVLEHYDVLAAQAEQLLQRAANGERSDRLLEEWVRLKAAWTEIEDRHSLAKVNVEFAGSMLSAALGKA